MIAMKDIKVACVIPTYNGKSDLERLIGSIRTQSTSVEIIIIDSESTDGTREVGVNEATHFVSIKSEEFNHGGTRQIAVNIFPQYEIFIFLTQDAVLSDNDSISNILKPMAEARIGAVCGRQLPHINASLFAKHARFFSYPEQDRLATLNDVQQLGLRAAFMSNSFAAYRRNALDDVGGFPKHVIFGEDMYVAAKMLLRGWSVAYCGAAQCRHSHNYSAADEFRRYFDIGVFHANEFWLLEKFGKANGEGKKFVLSELNFLKGNGFLAYGQMLFRTLAKYSAYHLGRRERLIPRAIKRKISLFSRYWN